jgi:hypothetical protein
MRTTYSLSYAARNALLILARMQLSKEEHVILTHEGVPVAKLVPLTELDQATLAEVQQRDAQPRGRPPKDTGLAPIPVSNEELLSQGITHAFNKDGELVPIAHSSAPLPPPPPLHGEPVPNDMTHEDFMTDDPGLPNE